MKKIKLGPRPLVLPLPVMLIGANVNGAPNFMTAAWCGIANSEPPMISVAIRYRRYTYQGVKQNATLSVNVPSKDLLKEMDYCGIASGAKEDKAEACGFNVFYGKLKTAPLIAEAPVGLECKVLHELHLGTHALFIVQIEETYVSKDCLTDGEPDAQKIQPIAYCRAKTKTYHAMGELLGRAHHAGRPIKISKTARDG